MTALVGRQPFHPLSVTTMQRSSRRLSARQQERDDVSNANGALPNSRSSKVNPATSDAQRLQSGVANTKKRKNNYDEEEDGFAFTRVKKQKPQAQEVQAPVIPEAIHENANTQSKDNNVSPVTKRKTKMTFSTPNAKEVQPVRRSKRLSTETETRILNPSPKPRLRDKSPALNKPASLTVPKRKPPRTNFDTPGDEKLSPRERVRSPVGNDGATKISLPFADTPVIRRNKAMREGKSSKGERRSSLGLRGRRASSLIDNGNSSALPHNEVDVPDFYKHIESESLPEPRRMRQLLTWCATRALDEKPIGTNFEDASARSAARVIQEELLRELSNNSELSDWFTREASPVLEAALPERPNPKNIQNQAKLVELEEQIQRLRQEKSQLEALLRPPEIPAVPSSYEADSEYSTIDKTLLSPEEAALLESLQSSTHSVPKATSRLNDMTRSIGPTIDSFADGIHAIGQYREAADNIAGRVLAICAGRLAEQEKQGRKRALQTDEDRSPRRDLSSVLRGLSKSDRAD